MSLLPSPRQIFSPVDELPAAASGERQVIPGGMPFGVKFYTEGVLVVGFGGGDSDSIKKSPAFSAGLRKNDIIISVDGKPLASAAALVTYIEESGGRELCLTARRGEALVDIHLTPESDSDGVYKAGLWVRDSGAGIGTVTYILPESGAFGGLGHGICDPDTGKPMPMGRGIAVGVNISGVVKGRVGDPGEIHGSFNGKKLGAVVKNCESGIFGLFSTVPEQTKYKSLPIGSRNTVKEGRATLLCTLDEHGIREYEIELFSVDTEGAGNRSFSVRITDPKLIEQTGGIVQGMSGSPIIQDGHLIGALTHVMISDPCLGYGIFIENMLADAPEALG